MRVNKEEGGAQVLMLPRGCSCEDAYGERTYVHGVLGLALEDVRGVTRLDVLDRVLGPASRRA